MTGVSQHDITPPGTWIEQALCRSYPADWWWPDGNEKHSVSKDVARALNICRQCPVTAECLQYALDNDEKYGIWGGTSQNQRKPMLQRHKQNREARTPFEQPRAGGRFAAKDVPCGTRRGYAKHIRNGEDACEPCLEARRIAKQQLRSV